MGFISGILVAILIVLVEIKIQSRTRHTPISYLQNAIEKRDNGFEIIEEDKTKETAEELAETLNTKI